MHRLHVDIFGAARLHDLPAVDNQGPAAYAADQIQVMADKHDGNLLLLVKIQQKLHNLRLHRHIQGGNRFIGDEELRIHEKRSSDADTLALSSRKLRRITVRKALIQADVLQHVIYHLLPLGSVGDSPDSQRLLHDPADLPGRVQGPVGVLEHHLGTESLFHLYRSGIILVQAEDRLRQGGLSASALSHDAENLRLVKGEGDIMQNMLLGRRFKDSAPHVIKDIQTVQTENHIRLGTGHIPLGNLRHQMLCILVLRMVHDLFHRALLHDLAAVYYQNLLADSADDIQVVGYKQDGHALFPVDLPQKLQNLLLHHHIQSRCRLIGDNQLRIADGRQGQHGPLPLPAGHLMGILPVILFSIRQTHSPEFLQHLLMDLLIAEFGVQLQVFRNLISHPENRIQAGHGFLEHHGHLIAHKLPPVAHLHLQEILPLENDLARIHPGIPGQKPHNGQSRHGLSRTGLSHHAHDIAGLDLKTHMTHGISSSGCVRETHRKILYFHQCSHHSLLPVRTNPASP